MKRRTLRLLPLMLLMLVAEATMAGTVDRGRARQAATTFLNNNGAQTRGLTDVTPATGFSNVYVFTTENSFVLMAADDRVQPILGYSLNGRFDIENMPESKRAWIEQYCNGIQYAIEHQTRATTEVTQQWRDLLNGRPNAGRATTAVGPLLQTQWDQWYPFNMLCPEGTVAGPVAIAMAQIMKYWNYPAHGIGSYSYTQAEHGELSADFQSTNYDWANMPNSCDSTSPNVQKQAVATLVYHCGVSVNTIYAQDHSDTHQLFFTEALMAYFNYSWETVLHNRSGYDDNAWISMLKADLNLNRPIMYGASGSGGGHVFVLDGYDNSNHFHVNWGYGGYFDEYYSINNMALSTFTMNDNHWAVFGIHPSDCTANTPANLTYSQNGRQVTLSWPAATGAYGYQVYCNNRYVDDVSSTSFTATAPYGSSVYYVRSVDAQGRLSLSSIAVTVNVAYPTPVVNNLAATVSGKNVNLSWTAPDWCYPETPTTTLTYGNGYYHPGLHLGAHNGSTCMFWGHRYPASSLSSYNNMNVYKVSFFANETGYYGVYVYKGTTGSHPETLVLEQEVFVESLGWYDIDLSTLVQIDASEDLWVFIYDAEARDYPAVLGDYSGSDGCYYSVYPTSTVFTYSSNYAFLIRTFVTDGNYTYDVYRNGTRIANNVNGTSYNDTNLANGTYSYYLKTHYYAGDTGASNQVTVEIANPMLTLANNADNSSAINAAAGQLYDVVLANRTFYKDGIWNTLCLPFNLNSFTGTPLEGATVKTLASSSYSNDVLTMNFTNALTSIQAGKPYIVKWDNDDADLVIHSAAEWDAFATNVSNGTQSYQGKVVKLVADISVTTMVGASGHPFKGTFNGLGHTLTVNLNGSEQYQAPFRYVDGATIKNLTVAGSITTSAKYAAGLVAHAKGTSTITRCVNNVTINSSVNGDGTHGGFIAVLQYSTATISDCVFNGKLLGPNTTLCGGFVGWTESNATLAVTNCLFAPTEVTLGIRYTFSRARDMSKVNITNSYYTQAFGELQGTPTTATGAALQALLGDGWVVSGGSVVPKLLVDTIVNPVFTDVTISSAIANVTTTYADFIGSYAPFSNNGLMLDAYNPNGNAQHAALGIKYPANSGYNAVGWFADATRTTPVTTIPFATDGKVTLYKAWPGNGTEQDPYIITTIGQLEALACWVNDGTTFNGKYFCLGADLTYDTNMPNNHTSIGIGSNHFEGTFDGYYNGTYHTISGIRVSSTSTYQGLFGTCHNSTVKNVTLTDVQITGDTRVGGIVGDNWNGTIENCHVDNTVTINGSSFIGGIAGWNDSGTVSDCSSMATVNGSGGRVAGIVGDNKGGTLQNLTLVGAQVTGNTRVGGIVGDNWNESTIENCLVVDATISGSTHVGGIVGWRDGGTMTGCIVIDATVSAGGGAIIGTNNVSSLQHNYYLDCTVGETTSNIGTSSGDVTADDGAVRGYYLTFEEHITSDALVLTIPAYGETPETTYNVAGSGNTITLGHDLSNYVATYYVNGEAIAGNSFTMPAEDVSVTATWAPDPMHFEQTGTNEYTIHTATGWDLFCDAMQDNDTYGRFVGKTVKLGANISVTRMSCSSGHELGGTFDGQGHTLTVNYQNNNGTVRTSPFTYVSGATIQNLIVAGNITGTASRAAGIVGETDSILSHVTNCISSVNVSGGSYTGGISVGGMVEITGCVFNGTIVGTNMSGGFVGWSTGYLVIRDCLFAPQEGSSISGGTFYFNGGGEITPVNSYYTVLLGTEQGLPAISDPAIQPIGNPTGTYPLSNLTAYVNGLKYGNTFYHAPSITQTVALAAGTNWCSFNVEITLAELQTALNAALPNATSITIKSQRNGQTAYNGTRWRGALNTLDVALMYQITVPESCEITVEGMPIDPAEHPVTIKNGPNWIGFPLSESMTPTNAFAGFAISGDVIRSKTQQANYTNRWRGALNSLDPGQGYIYNSSATNDRTLTFPSGVK